MPEVTDWQQREVTWALIPITFQRNLTPPSSGHQFLAIRGLLVDTG